MLFLIAVLLVLGTTTSRSPQEIFQNDPGDQGVMDTVRDVLFVVTALLLFIGVIAWEPSRWFRKKIVRKKIVRKKIVRKKRCIHWMAERKRWLPSPVANQWRKRHPSSLKCGNKNKPKQGLQGFPGGLEVPLVVEVQESEHNNEVEELEEVKGEMDVTAKQLKEREDRLVQTELDLIRREKLVKEKEHELKGKDVQLKLKKGLWIKEEEERKKREEEQEKEKKELEQWKRNQQERKIQAELRIINNEECGHENRKEYLQEEEFQLWIWEKRANTQCRERMHFVQKREEDIKKRMQIVQQMEQENQRREEQELEQQEIETLIRTKDDEIKERQLRIHEKGKELEHRENNLQKFKECTRQGLFKQREQCEELKGKEIIVLEKEREIRAREYDVQWREKNVLGRENKVKTPVKLVQDELQGKTKGEQMEKEIQTVEEKHQEGKSHHDDELQQQKQHGVEGAHHMQDLQQAPQKRRSFPPPPPRMKTSPRFEQEEVIVLPAGEEDAMFGPGSLVPPSYKLSKNSKRNIRLLQMADPRCFK